MAIELVNRIIAPSFSSMVEFEKYINTLKKNPMQHPAIEKEILNIDFNE